MNLMTRSVLIVHLEERKTSVIVDLEKVKELIRVNEAFGRDVKSVKSAVDLVEFVTKEAGLEEQDVKKEYSCTET